MRRDVFKVWYDLTGRPFNVIRGRGHVNVRHLFNRWKPNLREAPTAISENIVDIVAWMLVYNVGLYFFGEGSLSYFYGEGAKNNS